MSVVDHIKELTASKKREDQGQAPEAWSALRDLEEVETTLREIGVSLEPRFFDISLAARIGTTPRR